ncbi:ubiquinol-cytochrome C chaperone family protein [Chelativorans sp. Marseille-P2723]|uniref:ubiquinol-cytochrome C chaperone family protein n=1 Tax=Chelativorans sp. Marseille-P2723 TaxID=2709133 RepID=UPI00156F21EE|nr:ubiquinol-cytochrome C chaperone family protein [Chelativorans sp. Marseille-P2723]
MFHWLSGTARRNRRIVVDALYGEIVAAARQPRFYSEWQVADTPLGRFEMLSLHLFLFLHRLRSGKDDLREVAQEVTDQFFTDVDHSLRELGIGDLGVPKRMKKLARMFYGRLSAYGEAIDAGDVEALAAALKRNIAPEREAWNEAEVLAAYVLEAYRALAEQSDSDILAGHLRFTASSEIAESADRKRSGKVQ